ncbi:MAG: sensor histidine kinase [Weeksellaceae bacterium]
MKYFLLKYIIVSLWIYPLFSLRGQEVGAVLQEIESSLLSYDATAAFRLINTYQIQKPLKDSSVLFQFKMLELRGLEQLEMYDEAIGLSNELLVHYDMSTEQEVEIYLIRALVYELLGNFEKSKENLVISKSLINNPLIFNNASSEIIGSYYIRNSSYNRMLYIKTKQNKFYNEYLKNAQHAFSFAKAHNNKNIMATATLLLSFNSNITKEQRINYLNKSLIWWKITGDEHGVASVYDNLSWIFMDDYQKSIKYSDSAIAEIKAIPMYMTLSSIYETRYTLFQSNHMMDSALIYYKLHRIYLDSLNLQRKIITINRVDNAAFLKAKQLKNYKLKGDIKKSKRYSSRLSITIIIIISLSLILLYLFFKLTKKKREVVNSQRQIAENLNEKSLMLIELNHRVKNNLALILSLIQLQSHNGENDEENWSKLESRIQTMAMAHKLYSYSEDNLKGSRINVENYVIAIQSSIVSISGKKIKFDNYISAVDISLENALPIGIILNELLTNTIKHASSVSDILAIKFRLKLEDDIFKLKYSDNGEFFNNEFRKSTGLFILEAMTEQMKGSMNRNGACYDIILYKK